MPFCAFDQLLILFPPQIRAVLTQVPPDKRPAIEEIRLSEGRPMMVRLDDGDRFLTSQGLTSDYRSAPVADPTVIQDLLAVMTRSSVYAVEESMRDGFLSLPGGHRVGLVGTLRLRDGRIEGFRHVTGFNIRLNRPIIGVADSLLRSMIKPTGGVWSTLIISPPGCGKTTLLRDLIRALSYGDASLGLRPQRVGVADERSEIAASHRGVPQNDLGPRVDVIDQCPKRFALTMLLRGMGPDVLATDEIGHPEDARAIQDAAGAGVSLVCTTHGDDVPSLWQRPSIRPLLESALFGRIVILSRRNGPGTIEDVIEGRRLSSNGLVQRF